MGFKLVLLVEILSTALMVALKDNKGKSQPVNLNIFVTKQEEKKFKNYCT